MYSMPAILHEDETHYFVRHLFEGRAWVEKVRKEEHEKRIEEFYGVPLEELSSYLFELSKLDKPKDEGNNNFFENWKREVFKENKKPKKVFTQKELF
jgi:hypothetical protein